MKGLLRALWNGLLLRCPECRRATLFTGPFRMHAACPCCGCPVEREAGYFIGAIYINYAATVALCLGGFFALDWLAAPSLAMHLIIWLSVGAAFPLYFFRYARSLWLNVDHFVSPPSPPRQLRRP